MNIEPTDEQATALSDLLDWIQGWPSGPVEMSLSGPAGTGKSTMMQCLLPALKGSPYSILWTAMTGKAARRLSEASAVDATTLHSQLYYPPNDRPAGVSFDDVRKVPLVSGSIVVVDEASMMTPKIRRDLDQWISEGIRILYVGDGFQLPPILSKPEREEHGEDFTIFHEVAGPSLKHVIRNDDDILYAATYIREEGKVLLRNHGEYQYRPAPIGAALNDWLKDPGDHTLITWRNKLRMKANRTVRNAMGREHPLPMEGEQVLFCKNGQGVLNGEIATIESIMPSMHFGQVQVYELWTHEHEESILVSADGRYEMMDGSLPEMSASEYDKYKSDASQERRKRRSETGADPGNLFPIPITWAYTLTAHKAQGSEYRRASVFLADFDTGMRPMRRMTKLPDGSRMPFALRWVYTAITRAKESASLTIGKA